MSCSCGVCEGCTGGAVKGTWQKKLIDRMVQQSTDRFMRDHKPAVMPPKPVVIAVKKSLRIPVYAFFRYPMPPGSMGPKFEITYERVL